MDKSSLIDFDTENCFKIPSPLIPAPQSFGPRLSILENNPFDKVLKKIVSKDDPFEFSPTTPVKNKVRFNNENKENIGHLISPIQTPKLKQFKRLSHSPLRLNQHKPSSSEEMHDLSLNCTDTSLQILSESFINNDLSNSFMVACNLPLPSSSDEDFSKNETSKPENIPTIIIKDDTNDISILNNGFITDRLSSFGSTINPNSFHSDSFKSTELSNIKTSVSSTTSKSSYNQLDNAFIENTKQCSSISTVLKFDKLKINNSFGGFNINDRRLTYCKESHLNTSVDDSVFLEAVKIAEIFHKSAVSLMEDENIANCTPPWLEENIVFDYNDDVNDKKDTEPETSTKEILVESNENDNENNQELKNAKDLLNNLTAILNNSGNTKVDKKKLGESLINSLALALNIETPKPNEGNKLQRSKSDSRVGDKRKSLEKNEKRKSDNKLIVPKLKTQQTVAPVEKNIRVKKEKVSGKGPLKAFIPITNMAKTNKVLNQKHSFVTTPCKQVLQIKKTSTPNELKMKPPIAQSTPDISKLNSDNFNSTPKRHFGFPLSPLSRPASTNDINTCFNNSLSPKSSSNTNLNKSISKLPTVYTPRRNSASDMSTSRSSSLNRSYDNSQPTKPSIQLKRSSSFQNKTSTAVQKKDTNSTVKKYGMPGTLKPLKLVPKK